MATAQAAFFDNLQPQPADPLLSLIRLHQEDQRSAKIDLGVGVYRDAAGNTPVFRAVKGAERLLLETQPTKAYLGPEGNADYLDRLKGLLFRDGGWRDLVSIQTPGATGAIRLGAELARVSSPRARVFIGEPSWPIHVPLCRAAGLEVVTYRYFDPASQTIAFDTMMSALGKADSGDVVLLQGGCHNPTGCDLSEAQWSELAELVLERGLVPFIDLAYHGLGVGLDADLAGVHRMAAAPQMLLAYSCSKNFGLYRERVGALFVRTGNAALNAAVASNTSMLGRTLWSMPPDHGAAVVHQILASEQLTAQWSQELSEMRARIAGIREALAVDSRLAPLAHQSGMFSQLALKPAQIEALRRDHAIYMAGSGRVNLAGLTLDAAPRLVAALDKVGAWG